MRDKRPIVPKLEQMLEDDPSDVISKAAKGSGRRLTMTSNLEDFLAAGVDADTLKALPDYQPRVSLPKFVHQLVTPFGHLGVNSWLVELPSGSLLFDTGSSESELLRLLDSEVPDTVLITHSHPDHIATLSTFQNDPASTVLTPSKLEPGTSVLALDVSIHTFDASGHSTPALAYVLEHRGVTICVTGDLIFAGSIGGCASPASYQRALSNCRVLLDALPDEAILLPGHGPPTTAALEKVHNPFLVPLA